MTRKGQQKRNPYSWQEAVERNNEGRPLPIGTWVVTENGGTQQIIPSRIWVTDGSKTTGYMGGEPRRHELCDDGYSRPATRWRCLTPTVSDKWERARLQNPRPQSPALARKYAIDIANGKWLDNPSDCAVLDTNSGLWNAAHRSLGVALAKTSIWIIVAEGVDHKDAELLSQIDRGRARPAHINLTGLFKQCVSDEDAKDWIAISNQFLRGPLLKYGRPRTDAERQGHIRTNLKAHVWLTKMVDQGSEELIQLRASGLKTQEHQLAAAMTHPSVLCAFFRAYLHYTENKDAVAIDRLSKMLPGVLNGDLTAKRDTAAIVLRKRLVKGRFPSGARQPDRLLMYHLTEIAIRHFVALNPVTSLQVDKKGKTELFPLKQEQDDAAAASAVTA